MPDNATASQDMGHPQKGLEFQGHIFVLPEILISGKHRVKYFFRGLHEVSALISEASNSIASLENWNIS